MLCYQEPPFGVGLLFIGLVFRLLLLPLSFDALDEVDPLEMSDSYLV